MKQGAQKLLPLMVFWALLATWEGLVRLFETPSYVLPAPSLVLATLVTDRSILFDSLGVTLRITLLALMTAGLGALGLALLFARWRWVERSFFPLAVVLQVTPIVAVAPLLLIYLAPGTAVLVCAFLVAFFPVLSNTMQGLGSVDPNLRDLFQLYGATHNQTLRWLQIPTAMPYFFAGLRIAGGLSLIGAVVAEMAAGAAGSGSGLAFRILEAGYRLNIPRMFAALVLISLSGIALSTCLRWLTARVLRISSGSSEP